MPMRRMWQNVANGLEGKTKMIIYLLSFWDLKNQQIIIKSIAKT